MHVKSIALSKPKTQYVSFIFVSTGYWNCWIGHRSKYPCTM